ncbi:hypothetical protein D3C86_913210 [compost metagenome]
MKCCNVVQKSCIFQLFVKLQIIINRKAYIKFKITAGYTPKNMVIKAEKTSTN